MNQLAEMSIKFQDEIQGLCLLGTLPNSLKTFRMSLLNSTLDGIISLQLAKSIILNEEMRRKSRDFSSQLKVLVTEWKERAQSTGSSNRGNQWSSFRGKYSNVECYHCGMKEHKKQFM